MHTLDTQFYKILPNTNKKYVSAVISEFFNCYLKKNLYIGNYRRMSVNVNNSPSVEKFISKFIRD